MKKKGVSPIIATVLLIAIVVVIAAIIFIWARGLIKEVVMKNGENAESVCGKIAMEASLSSGTLYITNQGNIPIYGLNLKLTNAGTTTVQKIDKINLAPGSSGEYELNGAYEKVDIYPIILGSVKSGNKEYICENENTKKEVT